MTTPIGVQDLLSSERGVFCLLLLFAVTTLAVLGKIDGNACLDFIKWLGGALIASKTVTTAIEIRANKQAEGKVS